MILDTPLHFLSSIIAMQILNDGVVLLIISKSSITPLLLHLNPARMNSDDDSTTIMPATTEAKICIGMRDIRLCLKIMNTPWSLLLEGDSDSHLEICFKIPKYFLSQSKGSQ